MVRAREVGREMRPAPVDDNAHVAGVAWTGEMGREMQPAPVDDNAHEAGVA